jgi:hypothetical protein
MRAPEPAPEPQSNDHADTYESQKQNNRQSVDWYAGLASDNVNPASAGGAPDLATLQEEPDYPSVPDIQVDAPQVDEDEPAADPLADVDLATEHRARSLYNYDGQRSEDLSFVENLAIIAHPSKSGGDWWYGTLVQNGKKGFFPSSYVQIMEPVQAKALYAYPGGNDNELPFLEGDVLSIVDQSESDWWKTEKDGVIFIVPAAYLEVVG